MSHEGPSVFDMLKMVLDESREKLAAESSGSVKTAAAVAAPQPQRAIAGYSTSELSKLADACDHLADNLHLVADNRSPVEKLAEYAAIHDAMLKRAEEAGDVSQSKAHQTQGSKPESDPPETVTTDGSGTGVGGTTAIPSEETNTPGESMDAGESGASTQGHQSPKNTAPNEKPNRQDAATAMETNQEMMMPDQPEDVLKQAAMMSPTFQSLKYNPASVVVGLLEKAAQSGIRPEAAITLIRRKYGDEFVKAAEDALNPASISGGTEPLLQSDAGTPSPLSQGSEAGVNTPRKETGPRSGQAADALASVESAINLTKRHAKAHNKSALGEVLTEPALSSAHDKTLQVSLDNTSEAGVKISSAQADAARELLRKFMDTSPENAQKLAYRMKLAQDPDMAAAPPAAAEPAAAPPPEVAPEEEMAEEEGEAPVSDEALEAAKAGVTPEEVAEAEQLLAAQGMAAMQAAQAAPAPEEAMGPPGAAPVEAAPPPAPMPMT